MSFDPATFLNQTFEGANDTKRQPVPIGDDYLAIVEKVNVVPWAKKDGSASGLKLVVSWDIQDETVKALLDQTKIVRNQDVMLDLTESGGLDMGKGKNIGLGRLREATGQNDPARPFSFPMLQGSMSKIKIEHRVDGEDIFDFVSAARPVS